MGARECFHVAPFHGHYEPVLPCGTAVQTGDLLGWLHDFDRIDLPVHPMHAQVDGVIIAQAWHAPVSQGQHIIVVGIQQEWES